MGFYTEEEEMMKCRKHPSKHRATGVCPLCLRDRLARLCPECANVRPCACYPATTTTTTSSSSSSSSFSLASSSSDAVVPTSGVGAIGRVSNLIESEPAFQRSRSAAFPFLRSKISDSNGNSRIPPRSKMSFWSSVFKSQRVKKVEVEEKKMMRSKSVGMPDCDRNPRNEGKMKGRSWYFPSPIKALRSSKVLQERSPLCRG